jgi:outer membrane protein OmpA-like peptidoglycan-associated protein
VKLIHVAIILLFLIPSLCLGQSDDSWVSAGAAPTKKEKAKQPPTEVMDKDVILHLLTTPGEGADAGSIAFSSNAILFGYGSARLTETSYPQLMEIAKALNDPAVSAVPFFFVDGHTCNIGTDERNCRLSLDRARSVVQFLLEKGGVPAEKLKARGFGQRDPMVSNDTEENRQKNRRGVLKSGLLSLERDGKLLCTAKE